MGAAVDLMTFIPTGPLPPPKDKYQLLKEEYYRIRDENKQLRAVLENYDRELRRKNGELSKAGHFINHLQHEIQRSRDTINGFQNELNDVHQQLEDAKALSEVRGGKNLDAQVFSTKADTLSISEVGESVVALNEEIFHYGRGFGTNSTEKGWCQSGWS
jgi:predicted  nucleic acid-binding Zn-ribbon protein